MGCKAKELPNELFFASLIYIGSSCDNFTRTPDPFTHYGFSKDFSEKFELAEKVHP